MNNIFEMTQMVDYISDFINHPSQGHHMIIGGIVGTNLCRIVLDEAISVYDINNILIVEGCQDYIGFDKIPMMNHIYYGDAFNDMMTSPLDGRKYDAFKPKFMNPKHAWKITINTNMVDNYELMIINDAHLIPDYLLNSFISYYPGRIIMITDPYDIGGERFISVNKVTDTLNKLSPMLALARSVYNIDTRSINRKARGSIKEVNMTKRSVGKIDDKQYVTNDPVLCDIIRNKQLQSKFHKNQKMFVTSNKINIRIDDETNKRVSIPRNSILILQSASTASLYMKYRLYSTKIILKDVDVSYLNDSMSNAIDVKPANILHIDESHYHRYKNTVLIPDINTDISPRQRYSILKNSLELTIGYVKR